jgi:hypothetical protein
MFLLPEGVEIVGARWTDDPWPMLVLYAKAEDMGAIKWGDHVPNIVPMYSRDTETGEVSFLKWTTHDMSWADE